MRLRCFTCGKSVSNEVPDDTTVRAVLHCPECIPKAMPDLDALRAAVAAYDSNPYEQQWASPKEQAVLDAARALIESSHD